MTDQPDYRMDEHVDPPETMGVRALEVYRRRLNVREGVHGEYESAVLQAVHFAFNEGLKRNLPGRPKIVCLCGSTRFIEDFAITTWELETKHGYIVLGCTMLPAWYTGGARSHFAEQQGLKEQRDEHHLRKIDLADEILVLNIDGYIGESTRAEIEYATRTGKPVKYLEPIAAAGREES